MYFIVYRCDVSAFDRTFKKMYHGGVEVRIFVSEKPVISGIYNLPFQHLVECSITAYCSPPLYEESRSALSNSSPGTEGVNLSLCLWFSSFWLVLRGRERRRQAPLFSSPINGVNHTSFIPSELSISQHVDLPLVRLSIDLITKGLVVILRCAFVDGHVMLQFPLCTSYRIDPRSYSAYWASYAVWHCAHRNVP